MSFFTSIRLLRGKVLEGEKIRELTNDIIDKFSNEKLSYDEAVIILDKVKEILGEYSIIQNAD